MRGRGVRVLIAVLAVMGFLLLVHAGARYAWNGFLDTIGWEMSWFEISRGDESFEVASAHTLVVENRFGDLEVLPGGPDVRVERVLRAQGKVLEEAQERAAGLGEIEVGEDGGTLQITGLTGNADHHLRMDLVVHAPPEMGLKVEAVAGRVEVTGREGEVCIDASAGDVEVDDCAGPVTVQALAGGVRVRGATTGVTVDTMAGETKVEGARGRVDVHANAGQVVLSGLRADRVRVSVGCGSVRIALAEPFRGTLKAEAAAGDITILVPRGSQARVVTDTTVGSISDRLPREVLLREGPGMIRAETGAGAISLLEAGAESEESWPPEQCGA